MICSDFVISYLNYKNLFFYVLVKAFQIEAIRGQAGRQLPDHADRHVCMSRNVMPVMDVLLQNHLSFMEYRNPVSPQLSPRSSPGPCHPRHVSI